MPVRRATRVRHDLMLRRRPLEVAALGPPILRASPPDKTLFQIEDNMLRYHSVRHPCGTGIDTQKDLFRLSCELLMAQ